MNYKSKKNIIFDLGRILVGLDNERCIAAFEKVGLGRITTGEFCDEVRRICRCDVADADIIWAWNELLTGIPDEKKAALLELRRAGHRVFLLSNTNFMHWDKCAADFFGYRDSQGREYGVDDYFDRVFLSCAMHMAKPSPEIFAEALRQAGIRAEDTLFIDDRADNCQGAAKVGITTLHDPYGTQWMGRLLSEE